MTARTYREAGPRDFAFRTEVVAEDERTRVCFLGELDLAQTALAEMELMCAEALGTTVVVDLSELAFIDLHGLRVILAAHHRLGDRLLLVPGPPAVQQVFELTGTLEALRFVG